MRISVLRERAIQRIQLERRKRLQARLRAARRLQHEQRLRIQHEEQQHHYPHQQLQHLPPHLAVGLVDSFRPSRDGNHMGPAEYDDYDNNGSNNRRSDGDGGGDIVRHASLNEQQRRLAVLQAQEQALEDELAVLDIAGALPGRQRRRGGGCSTTEKFAQPRGGAHRNHSNDDDDDDHSDSDDGYGSDDADHRYADRQAAEAAAEEAELQATLRMGGIVMGASLSEGDLEALRVAQQQQRDGTGHRQHHHDDHHQYNGVGDFGGDGDDYDNGGGADWQHSQPSTYTAQHCPPVHRQDSDIRESDYNFGGASLSVATAPQVQSTPLTAVRDHRGGAQEHQQRPQQQQHPQLLQQPQQLQQPQHHQQQQHPHLHEHQDHQPQPQQQQQQQRQQRPPPQPRASNGTLNYSSAMSPVESPYDGWSPASSSSSSSHSSSSSVWSTTTASEPALSARHNHNNSDGCIAATTTTTTNGNTNNCAPQLPSSVSPGNNGHQDDSPRKAVAAEHADLDDLHVRHSQEDGLSSVSLSACAVVSVVGGGAVMAGRRSQGTPAALASACGRYPKSGHHSMLPYPLGPLAHANAGAYLWLFIAAVSHRPTTSG
jgi:hypothetical protein